MTDLNQYLRLHVEDRKIETAPEPYRGIGAFTQAFAAVSGWNLEFTDCLEAADTVPLAFLPEEFGGLTFSPVGDFSTPCGAENARAMAEATAELLGELEKTRYTLWQREAELAAGCPVMPRADEEAHLAERLESTLRCGGEAIDCDAAALYLLDDETRVLKLRAAWNLPSERFLEEPRPLRGSVAELEALVGNAVVIENTELLPHWGVPEEFAAAVCVPVSTPSTLLGVLWYFAMESRPFPVDQTNLIEIVAGRLSAELEREILISQGVKRREIDRELDHAAHWQFCRQPQVKPELEGYEVAGWTAQRDEIGGCFHHWSVLPDGNLAIAVADAEGGALESALVATTVQAAINSHASYRHSAADLVNRVNDTLLESSIGSQFASMVYGQLEPESGILDLSGAGDMTAWRICGKKASPVEFESSPLGSSYDLSLAGNTFKLKSDETVILLSDSVCEMLLAADPNGANVVTWLTTHASPSIDTMVQNLANSLEITAGATILGLTRSK